jgi:hypothetical protein
MYSNPNPFRALCSASPVIQGLLVFAVALTAQIVFALLYEIPVPGIHDEFSYLLGADTFASGRLTNPTHPMHAHFESYHIFHTPTYQSKYPPGQAAFLALGQVISGEPILGVWISFALACAALTWMLRPLFSSGWCVIGGLLPLLNTHVFKGWGQTYWGGNVAWFGAALFIGGWLRLKQGRSMRTNFAIILGLFVLGNSRPFEGVLLTIGMLILTAWHLRKTSWRDQLPTLIRATIPLCVGGGVLLTWTLFYNHTLTGNAFRFPHTHFGLVQPTIPAIAWRSNPVPRLTSLHWAYYFFVYWWPFPFAVMALAPKNRRQGLAPMVLVLLALTTIVIVFTAGHPHYLAPVFPLIILWMVYGLSQIPKWFPRFGEILVCGVVMFQVLAWVLPFSKLIRSGPPETWAHQRNNLLQRLKAYEDVKFLVLVTVAPGWFGHHEVVYNPADIDQAPVLFARDLGETENQKLTQYFSDRVVIPLRVGFPDEEEIPSPESLSSDEN